MPEYIASNGLIGDDQTAYWYQKPLNILQTNIREVDAQAYNAQSVVKYMLDTGCNVLVINAGGIVDFFPNPLPAGMPNKFMGDRDILREISIACKAADIRVIARIDFRGAEEEVYRKFPDWFMRNAGRQPVFTTYEYGNRKLTLYASCYLGKHRNEYLKDMVSHILKNYPVDGIWHNAPVSNGICYCDRCATAYKTASGQTLPEDKRSSPKELDQYMLWKTGVADRHMDGIKRLIKSYGQDKIYCAEIFSMFGVEGRIHSGIDLSNARSHFDFLVSVAFQDSGDPDRTYQNLSYASTITKFLKSMAPEREAIILCGGNGTQHRMVSDPKVDFKVWLWQVLAAGGRWWNNYFTNIPDAAYDRRNIYDHTDAFLFVKKFETLLERHAAVATVGIYYSRPTRLLFREKLEEGDRFGNEIRGIETVLVENHIPYDFILDDQVSKEKLEKYSLVILPDVRCMSDGEIGLIKNYVQEGGNLLATYSSSLYDNDGTQRIDYGLGEIIGVRYAAKRENTRKDNYQYILDKKHPLVKDDSSETELLFNAGFTALAKPLKNANVICTWVPTIQNQPPDKSWVEKFSTEFPTVTESKYGKGNVIYFANQPGLLSYEIGHPDIRNLLLRSIKHLAGSSLPIETTAPSSVNIGLTKSLLRPGDYILSLVNTTAGTVRPIRELIPVLNISVKLRLDGLSVDSHQVLRCQRECKADTSGRQLHLQFSRLEDFCAVHIRMRTETGKQENGT